MSGKRVAVEIIAGLVVLGAGIGIGSAGSSTHAVSPAAQVAAAPAVTVTTTAKPDVTVTRTARPAVTVTRTARAIVTVTVTETAQAAAAPAPAPAPTTQAAPAGPQTLFTYSGSGIYNGAPFTVSGPVTVSYSYNCAAFGGSGNFIGDLETTNWQSDPSAGDDQGFANALGTSGSSSSSVYPRDPGSQYYVSVNSECDWTVTVTSAG